MALNSIMTISYLKFWYSWDTRTWYYFYNHLIKVTINAVCVGAHNFLLDISVFGHSDPELITTRVRNIRIDRVVNYRVSTPPTTPFKCVQNYLLRVD